MKKKTMIWIGVALVVLVLSLIALAPNTLIYGDYNSVFGVDISDDGTIKVMSGASYDYKEAYGVYYIEVDGEPYGYYSFTSGYSSRDGLRSVYQKEINPLDLSPIPQKIEVWSDYGVDDGRTDYSNVQVCGQTEEQFDEIRISDGTEKIIKRYTLCSQSYYGNIYKGSGRWKLWKDGACYYKGSDGEIRPDPRLDTDCLKVPESYEKVIPSDEEIIYLKSKLSNYDSKIISNGESFVPFYLNKVKIWFNNKWNSILDFRFDVDSELDERWSDE